MTPETLKKAIWLYETVRKRGRVNRGELEEAFVNHFQPDSRKAPSRFTLLNLIKRIKEEWDVGIVCDNYYCYHIEDDPVDTRYQLKQWVFKSFYEKLKVEEFMDIEQYLIIEHTESGEELIGTIFGALRERKTIRFGYMKFTDVDVSMRELEPYRCRLFHKRWYVFGKLLPSETERHPGEKRMFAFDRMSDVEMTGHDYEMDNDLSISMLFADTYGAYCDQSVPATRIVIRAFGKEACYQKSLPLHPSMKIVHECEEYTDFEYLLRPTKDFKMDILKFCSAIKVLEPAWLVDEIKIAIAAMAERYGMKVSM